jgi:Xaa-Pro dipeptidase
MSDEHTVEEPSIQIPRAEFAARTAALLAHVQAQHLDGVVLFESFHVLYFTGFAFAPTERPIVFMLNQGGEQALLVPRLEVEHARQQSGLERVEHYVEYPGDPHPMQLLRATLADMGISARIGADLDGYPPVFGYRGPSLSEVMGCPIMRLNEVVEDMMAIKSAQEIALIRESIKWSNLAHRLLQRYTRAGATETEVTQRAGQEATQAMLAALGPLYRAQSVFWEGVGAIYRGQIGRNAAIPHALANNLTFQPGDVLVSGTLGPLWGYNSELERTMILGPASAEQQRLFAHMKEAQEVAFAALRPGATCADVDRAVRAYYERHQLMGYWRHHTGHGLGLRNHEGPFLDSGDHTVLRPGMVFSVEPGLYAPELGGFRHSDTVLITTEGCAVLTYYPRDLESLTIPL